MLATYLSGTVGTTTGNTGNTCDRTTGTPRLGTSLVTGLLRDSVSLTLVLVHASVDRVNNVGADGGLGSC